MKQETQSTNVSSNPTWPVHEDYDIEHGALFAVGEELSLYDPLAHQEVVAEFGRLHVGDENGLLRFALTWGLLGWEELGIVGPGGDPLHWIWGHVNNVRLVLELYHYLKRGDLEGLSQFLDRYRTPSVIDPEAEVGPLIAITLLDGTLVQERFPWGDPGWVAERIITSLINCNLEGSGHRLFAGPLRLQPYAPTPLVAIYFHLASIGDAEGGRPVARCQDPICGKLFIVKDRRQRYCPPPPDWTGRRGSPHGARDRKRRQRQRQKEGG